MSFNNRINSYKSIVSILAHVFSAQLASITVDFAVGGTDWGVYCRTESCTPTRPIVNKLNVVAKIECDIPIGFKDTAAKSCSQEEKRHCVMCYGPSMLRDW